MAIPPKWIDIIQAKINDLPKDDEFELKTLLGERWDEIVRDMQTTPQEAGRAFSRCVDEKRIHSVRFSRVQRSPHATIWLKE